MPNCDKCGMLVKRRSKVSDLSNKELQEEIMVCSECYEICKNKKSETCDKLKTFIDERKTESTKRSQSVKSSPVKSMENYMLELEIDKALYELKNKAEFKRCISFGNRKDYLYKFSEEELDEMFLNCNEIEELDCKGRNIQKSKECKEIQKNKMLAEAQIKRRADKAKEKTMNIRTNLMKTGGYTLKPEYYPAVPK